MTMLEILERASDWSESRGITQQSSNVDDYIKNVVEELGERILAFKEDDEDGKIDAVADISVFTLTELFKRCYEPKNLNVFLNSSINHTIEMAYEEPEDTSNSKFVADVVRLLGVINEYNFDYILRDILALTFAKKITMGYYPLKVMDEVIKVVESRIGEWNDEVGKFIKDTSPEAQAKWYVPNYKECLVWKLY